MNSSNNKTLIVIGGPTGVGKSDLALKLAVHLNTEIINADSRQIYKELNIGVNKPEEKEMLQVPHHLIGHVSIHEEYNAGQYEQEALKVLAAIFEKKNTAILVGGTGLYIRTIIEGLDYFPDINPGIKKEVHDLFIESGIGALQLKVAALDPDYYATMDQHNPRRLSRALEVIIQTGVTFTQQRTLKVKARPFKILKFFIEEDRVSLYRKLNARVDQMILMGLEQEALDLYPHKYLKSLQTVGYSEWFDHFDQKITRQQAIDKIKQHTRNYAKRQWTWWKPLGWPTIKSGQSTHLLQQVHEELIQ